MDRVRALGKLMGGHPSATDVAIAVLGVVLFFLMPVAAQIDPEHLGIAARSSTAGVALTLVSAVALTQLHRFPLPVLMVATAATGVGFVWGDRLSLAPVALGIAVFVYSTNTARHLAVRVIGAVSVVLWTVVAVTAAGGRMSWERQDVVLWVWTTAAAGIAVRSRRKMIDALEDRARRAEESRDELARRRVAEDRVRIARELHDVIAHHVAVINVQAGVAEHMVERDPEAAHRALGHVRSSAATVLSELQTVLGVLRQDEAAVPTSPAPGLAELDELVASYRSIGVPVRIEYVGTAAPLPPAVDLTAYRLIQEALTNAHNHAPGAAVTVRLRHRDADLEVEVVNGPATEAVAAAPAGSGLGLVGMRERIVGAGGRLETGPTGAGGFRVAGWLPGARGTT